MNKKDIILHIGLYKTGSTFVQSHYNQVKVKGYVVFLERSEIVNLLLEYLNNPIIETKEKIINIIQNEKCKKILISSEAIFGHQYYHFKDCSKRFHLLEELFHQPKYVIFFREPSSIIYSGYFQGLQKSHSLKFENYISENKNDLFNRNFYNYFAKGLDYKIYNYNNIFKNYLTIQNRVLFVEYERFFTEKKVNLLNNFIGYDIQYNFDNEVNKSIKNLMYLEFYNNFYLFKIIKILWLKFNKLFFRYKQARDISVRLNVLINLLNKIIPKRYFRNIDDKHQILLEEIKNYHAKNYKNFRNKIKSSFKN